MKASICATVAAAVIAIPSLAFAQADTSNNGAITPITRAQVRADLVRVEQAGYNPTDGDTRYPVDIQAAQARIDADHAYGGASNASANGAALQNSGQ